MRVGIITQGVSALVRALQDHPGVELAALVESAPRGYRHGRKPPTAERARAALLKLRHPEHILEWHARRGRVPYLFLHRDNVAACADWLRARECDVVFVWSMSRLLPAELIAIPRLGMLNTHPSLLPDYRGANPWYWLYHDNVRRSGVTLHHLDPGEDSGDIALQREFEIAPGMRLPELERLAFDTMGVQLVRDAIDTLQRGEPLPRHKQPASSPTRRARRIKTSEHRTLIDWERWPLEHVWHVLRGTEDWLDAIDPPTGIHTGQRWTVLDYERCRSSGVPSGSVVERAGQHVVVCRDGIIHLEVRFRARRALGAIYRALPHR